MWSANKQFETVFSCEIISLITGFLFSQHLLRDGKPKDKNPDRNGKENSLATIATPNAATSTDELFCFALHDLCQGLYNTTYCQYILTSAIS